MTLSRSVQKLVLTAHVTSSVGWLGAVAVFLAFAISGLNGADELRVRTSYTALELTGWCVIVPLSLISPLTGVLQSLGSAWGLFRHYWVLIKLLITIPATVLLLIHMQPVGHLARAVAETTLARGELAGLRLQLVADAAAAVLVLVVATTLSIYKPQGLTPYGRREDAEIRGLATARHSSSVSWGRWALIGLVLLVLVVVIIHLVAGGLHGH